MGNKRRADFSVGAAEDHGGSQDILAASIPGLRGAIRDVRGTEQGDIQPESAEGVQQSHGPTH